MLMASALIHLGLIYVLNLPFTAQIRRTAEEIAANMNKYVGLAFHVFIVLFVFWFMCSVHVLLCVFNQQIQSVSISWGASL